MPKVKNSQVDDKSSDDTGRPRKELDLPLLKLLASAGCSHAEAAAYISRQSEKLGGDTIDVRTFKRRIAEPIYAEAWNEGVDTGRAELRLEMKSATRAKFRSGPAAGTPTNAAATMMLHLSKHWLGMHDRVLNLNVSIDDLDKAIVELERRTVAASGGQPAGDAGNDRTPQTLTTAQGSAALH